jgi:hypothetical protein
MLVAVPKLLNRTSQAYAKTDHNFGERLQRFNKRPPKARPISVADQRYAVKQQWPAIVYAKTSRCASGDPDVRVPVFAWDGAIETPLTFGAGCDSERHAHHRILVSRVPTPG